MINENGILQYFQERGINTSLEEINKLVFSEDRESITSTQNKRFKYEIWDKKSSINGVDAKDIIKSRNYTIGQAYLIYIDDALVYFQDHNPEKSGYVKMNKSEAEKLAQDFINKKVEEYTDNIIIDKVMQEILSK
jgi:hypothetical protein